jgi:HSP20 family molecular chaperone IbpA
MTVTQGVLDVKINRKPPTEGDVYHHKERRFNGRYRRVTLPTYCDGDHPVANLCCGVLKITFPKLGDTLKLKKIPIMH